MLIRLRGTAAATLAKRAYIYWTRHRPTAELKRELGLGYRTVLWWKGRVLTGRTDRRGRTGCMLVWRTGRRNCA